MKCTKCGEKRKKVNNFGLCKKCQKKRFEPKK